MTKAAVSILDDPITLIQRTRLQAADLSIGYADNLVIDRLNLAIPHGAVTAIIGSNGCGKSTLLRALGRLLTPKSGSILLDGEVINTIPTKKVAQRLGFLPQSATAPAGITVEDLVSRGRYPHQSWFQLWSAEDAHAVARALTVTKLKELAHQPVDQLSGGQRQRAWLALALAQETELLLLDEPTTYLDLAHQIDMLELIRRLPDELGRTVVMVLHDLNLAARYADRLVAMRDGRVIAQGQPSQVLTPELIRDVFALESRVISDPVTGTPLVVPSGSLH